MRMLRAVALASLLGYLAAFLLLGEGDRRAADFVAFYVGGTLVAHDHGQALYDLDRQRQVEHEVMGPFVFATGLLPFVYPPFVALPFVPLSHLPLLPAYWVWQGLTVLVLGSAVALLLRTSRWRSITRSRAGLSTRTAVLVLLGAFPVYAQFHSGQLSAGLLLALTAATVAFQARRDVLAGIALAALLAKPQLIPVLVLGLLAWQRFRALAGLGAGALALGGVSVAISGWNWWQALAGLVLHLDAFTTDRSEGWWAVTAASHLPAAGAWALGAAGVLAAVTAALWRPGAWRPGTPDWESRWATLLLAGLFASPHLLSHDLLLALVPAVLLWQAYAHRPRRLRILAGGGIALNLAALVDARGLALPVFPLLLGAAILALAFAPRQAPAEAVPAARAPAA